MERLVDFVFLTKRLDSYDPSFTKVRRAVNCQFVQLEENRSSPLPGGHWAQASDLQLVDLKYRAEVRFPCS